MQAVHGGGRGRGSRIWLITSGALVALAAVIAPDTAGAADPAPVAPPLRVAGECPRGEAVLRALVPLMAQEPGGAAPPEVRINDLGNRYEITAAGQSGQYEDPARNCAERARVAAVFIALALQPPAVHHEEPSPPPPPEPHTPAPVLPRPPPPAEKPAPKAAANPGAARDRWAYLQIGGKFETAPIASSSTTTTAGVELRFLWGARSFGLTASAGILAASLVDIDGVVIREQRFPFDLGFRVPWHLGFIDLAMDLGAAAALFTTRADDLSAQNHEARLDFGGRAALEARFDPAGRLSPYLGAHVEYFPRAYTLIVDPRGTIGTTPHVWLGATLGLSLSLE